MLRLVIYFLAITALATFLSWLADNPGSIVVKWRGYIWDTNVFQVAILLSFLAAIVVFSWSLLRIIWQSPAIIGNFINRRREKRGLEALSSGMIAVGAGDRSMAIRYATQARASLPNEPMTHLLRAQAAQLTGDRVTSRRIFEAMLATPDTEALGLRGLFLEAKREEEMEAAQQFAERALKLNSKLSWPVHALFDIQCKAKDWDGALETLVIAKKHGHIEKQTADRRRAVLLAGQAHTAEDNDPERALNLALEAHNLAPNLVPASAVAGRLLAAKGRTSRASKVLQRTWKKSPHPELAVAYAYARLGDSPRDRLKRVQGLASSTPNIIESPIAVANAAIEARAFDVARAELAPLTEGRLTQRVCTLMAKIEHEDASNTGGVREWLARAINAPRDPAWTADGVISDFWQPVSPITGALDAFEWRVPVEVSEARDKATLSREIEEFVNLGGHKDITISDVGKGQVDQRTIVKDKTILSDAPGCDVDVDQKDPSIDSESDATVHPDVKPMTKQLKKKVNKSDDQSNNSFEDIASNKGKSGAVEHKPELGSKKASYAGEDKAINASQFEDLSETRQKYDTLNDQTVVKASAPLQTAKMSPSIKPVQSSTIEAEIFVPPRAPDDPGTDNPDNKR